MPKSRYKKRKDGRYYTTVQDGYKENGTPNKIPIYAKTESELDEKKAEIKRLIKLGQYRKPSDITVEEYATHWFNTYKINKGINTRNMYKYNINSHIVPAIGFIQIKELKRSDIQRMLNERISKVRLCEQLVLTLNQILNMAIEDDVIIKNPCNKVELPKRIPKPKRALTKNEIKAIGKCDFTDEERALVNLLYYFGLRREEAIALMKSDFDFNNDKLRIERAVVFDINKGEIKETKTPDGVRTLDIPEIAKPALIKYVKSIENSMYVFTKEDGNIMSKSAYNCLFNSIRNKINEQMGGNKNIKVTDLTAYTFRHNFCTLLYYSDVSIKKAADLMGHKDITMIMKVYAHLDEEKEKTNAKINKMFENIAL